MDSLSKATIALNEELQKRPVIKGTNVSTQEQVIGVDENGKPQKVKTQIVNTVTLANPLATAPRPLQNKYKTGPKSGTMKRRRLCRIFSQ